MAPKLETLLTKLHRDNSIKAWSLIMTFFGDSVAPRGGAVATTTIQTVMDGLGIDPGTVRTACSRLAKDGWVTRQKVGRNSFYRLASTGLAPFSKAENIIYAGPSVRSNTIASQWLLVTRAPQHGGNSELYQGGVKLSRDCYLFANLNTKQLSEVSKDHGLVSTVDTSRLPSWVTDIIAPENIAETYRQLTKSAIYLGNHLPVDPLGALIIRTLLIHEWRKQLLRRSDLNTDMLPTGWPYEECRTTVAELYHQLSPMADEWLNSNALGPDGPLGKSKVDTLKRFR